MHLLVELFDAVVLFEGDAVRAEEEPRHFVQQDHLLLHHRRDVDALGQMRVEKRRYVFGFLRFAFLLVHFTALKVELLHAFGENDWS